MQHDEPRDEPGNGTWDETADDAVDHGIERFEQDGASLLGDDAPASAPVTSAAEIEAEAPLALYRRYRPETFADVIGQEHVTEPLGRALANNRVNHAYLFSGPRGCGKTTSARILARCLNCEQGPTPTPCGECQSCRDLARGGAGSIDVIEIDAASHGGVEDARDLRERAIFAPVHSRYKVYIVDEAHMVTPAGFNALLKLVEEPPPHVKFVFATTEPDKVIGTIRSRTHHYPFRLVPPRTLTSYLARLCEAEGVTVDPAVLPLVVRAGAGSVRDSLSVLDQLLGGAEDTGVSYDHAAALLGFTPEALLDEIVDAFAAGDGQGVFAAVDRVIEVGQDPRRFGEDLLRRFRDLVVIDAVPDAVGSGLVDVPEDQADRMRSQASTMGLGELTRAAEVMSTGLTAMRGTTAPRLHLELMCARVLLPGSDVDERGVHARLDRLERRLGMIDAGESQPTEVVPQPGNAPQSGGAPQTDGAPQADPRQVARERSDGPRQQPPQQPPREEEPPPPPPPPPPSDEGHPPAGPPAQQQRPSGDGPGLGTAEFRQVWPQVLDRVKSMRRLTWILLSQNAHVAEVHDGVLTLALHNQGVRDSFLRGGNENILREAIVAVVGADLRIDYIVDGGPPGGGPGGGSPGGGPHGGGGPSRGGPPRDASGGPPPPPPPSRESAPEPQATRHLHAVRDSPAASAEPGQPDSQSRREHPDPQETPSPQDPPAAHEPPEDPWPSEPADPPEPAAPPQIRAVAPPPPPVAREQGAREQASAPESGPVSSQAAASAMSEADAARSVARAGVVSAAQRAREQLAASHHARSAASPNQEPAPEDGYDDFDPAELRGAQDAGADYRELLSKHLGAELIEEISD